MAKEENLVILKMLQDGTITADQAAELLLAVDKSEPQPGTAYSYTTATPPAPPVPPVPPAPASAAVPLPPNLAPEAEGEAFTRARARIAAARERVAGVQEKLSAAEERLEMAKDSPNPWEQVADALKDVPGARSVAEAFRGIDPGRLASNARRQARRVARSVRSTLGDLEFNINLNLADAVQGEPTFSAPREATAAIPPGGTLRVRNTLGNIEVQGADVPEVRAAGVLKVWAADLAAAEAIAAQVELVVEAGSDGPSLSVRHPDRLRKVMLDLRVFVPEQGGRISLISLAGDLIASGLKGISTIVLATQSGDAKVSEIAGDVAVETASGDVAVEGVAGNVSASSASGDIQAIRVTGQSFRGTTQSGDIAISESVISALAVETVSGDAMVTNASGRTLRVRSVSGDTKATGTAFTDETHLDTVSGYVFVSPADPIHSGLINLITVSGDAELKLPTHANLTLEVTTKSGDVDARFIGPNGAEKTLKGSGVKRLMESVGTGTGARISLSTISGDLTINQDSPVIEIS